MRPIKFKAPKDMPSAQMLVISDASWKGNDMVIQIGTYTVITNQQALVRTIGRKIGLSATQSETLSNFIGKKVKVTIKDNQITEIH